MALDERGVEAVLAKEAGGDLACGSGSDQNCIEDTLLHAASDAAGARIAASNRTVNPHPNSLPLATASRFVVELL